METMYKFYDTNVVFEMFLKINADKETVEKLIDEYRDSNPDYDDEGWIAFLKNKGLNTEKVEFTEMYF